jgi:hypothetical protein
MGGSMAREARPSATQLQIGVSERKRELQYDSD